MRGGITRYVHAVVYYVDVDPVRAAFASCIVVFGLRWLWNVASGGDGVGLATIELERGGRGLEGE